MFIVYLIQEDGNGGCCEADETDLDLLYWPSECIWMVPGTANE